MARFAIAFIAPTDKTPLKHQVVEAADQETALRSFFGAEAAEFYSNDDQGYFYFREDFSDRTNPGGSIIAID